MKKKPLFSSVAVVALLAALAGVVQSGGGLQEQTSEPVRPGSHQKDLPPFKAPNVPTNAVKLAHWKLHVPSAKGYYHLKDTQWPHHGGWSIDSFRAANCVNRVGTFECAVLTNDTSELKFQYTFTGLVASAAVNAEELKVEFTPTAATFTCTATTNLTIIKVDIERDVAGGTVDYQALTDATRKVLPGQKMNLKAEVEPSTLTVTDWEWTLPGVVFKNYTASQTTGTLTPIAAGDKDDQTVGFYWADNGDDRDVKCKVKIGGQWFECGEEVFHVKKPTCTMPLRCWKMEAGFAYWSADRCI